MRTINVQLMLAEGAVEKRRKDSEFSGEHTDSSKVFDTILARNHNMQNNYYALALEQAANERAEIRAQLEPLLVRDVKLESLLIALKDLLPAEGPAATHFAEELPMDDPTSRHHDQAPWHEHHGHDPENPGN
jgi:hypothetical protein